MLGRMLILCICACCLLTGSFCPAAADILIRWHDADADEPGVRDTETVQRTDSGLQEDSFAWQMANMPFVSQRESRFAVPEYQYINHQPFSKNGCGPASLFNGMQAVFGAIPEAGMLELMVLLSDFHRPAAYGINYNRVMTMIEPDPENCPVITEALASADRVVKPGALNENTLLELIAEEPAGVTVAYSRFSLMKDAQTFVRLAQILCEAGYEDAVLSLATVSAGTEAVMSPFGMGENGHYITLVAQAGEFCGEGVVYAVDSFPRALRDETLNERYTLRYYFAGSNGLSAFRTGYHVVRLRDTVLMCTLDESARTALWESGDVRERAKLLDALMTYGTATLFIRFGRAADSGE
ncbi:MAG: hypothetical protein IJK28_00850 [Clostridia bacterium]|nr:hypothetical protein [Clostridia bacterium]